MKKLYTAFVLTICSFCASAQLNLGVGYGTFSIPGMTYGRFKGYGPTLKLMYRREESQFFFDAALLSKKNRPTETIAVKDENGMVVGNATGAENYSIKHFQLGFLNMFTDYEKPVRFFLGGGLSYSLIKNSNKYSLPGFDIQDKVSKTTSYGFNFSAGLQWKIEPITLELKGNIDLMLEPMEAGNDEATNFVGGTRLGILIPITKGND